MVTPHLLAVTRLEVMGQADPGVFDWYVKNYGPEVNLFVDHSQIVPLDCLRSGIWGTAGVWGRVLTYRPDSASAGNEQARPRSAR